MAVGGVSNNGYTGGVEVFNPDARYWTQKVPVDLILQTPRSAFATVFIQNKTESELKLVEIELPIDPTTTSPPLMAKQGVQYSLIPNALTNITTTHFKMTFSIRRLSLNTSSILNQLSRLHSYQVLLS